MMNNASTIDVNVEKHGGLLLFRLNTAAATAWVDANVDEDAQWFGGALVAEHRYALDLAQGMLDAGLLVA